jgi:hypothetical protein
MRNLLRHASWLIALTINSPAAAAATANTALETTGIPAGFDELASSKVVLVDVYFGGRKIGEAFAVTEPGLLRFRSPHDLLERLPAVVAAPELGSALERKLPTNSQAACSSSNSNDCGVLAPEVVAIIFDEDRFRVDLFVNPKFLRTSHANPQGYLPAPSASLSLTNSLGLAASGTIGGSSAYNLQNRTIIGLGSARLRANTSVASHLGLLVDDFVGELDRKDLRYSAGLFWAPGNEFIGQRRIIGAGVGTQFDTSADRQAMEGTPLILFLDQPSRVELLVDGRLVSSRSYPAGNNDLDTLALPDGSYPVVIRVHQSNGSVRDERRFFVRNAQIAPAGHPIFYAYGGMLANTRRNHPVSLSRSFYYQAGAAWRLTNNVALDVAAMGTQRKAIVEAGAWIISGQTRFRAAALGSSAGDKGALVQVSSAGGGPLNISFDLRRIWSHDGRPLIPLPSYANSFDTAPPVGVQLASGSYTQATASVGLRLGSGYLSMVGSYRKDRNLRADYSIGPNVSLPVVTRNQVQLVFEASAQRTRSTTAAFAGFRALFTSGRMSMLSRLGRGVQSGSGSSVSRAVGSFSAQYSHETEDRTAVNLEGGLDRDIETSTLRAGGTLDSRFGSLRGDVLHNLEGRGGTQYDVSFQSGMALGPHAAAWGGRDLAQSAIVVSVNGDATDAWFNVLVDDAVRGRVRTGQRLSLFLPGYRAYKVRLVPAASSAVSFDGAAREVTLYPGNVRSLAWNAQSYFTLFAQATAPGGAPISNALVQTTKGIAETDANGYFQIDTRHDEAITIATADGAACQIRLGSLAVKNDFASAGKLVCQ